MEKHIFKKNFQEASLRLEKKGLGFPLAIPIYFNKLSLGNIRIDFDQNFKDRVSLKKTREKRKLIESILRELIDYMPIFKKSVEFTLQMEQKAEKLATNIFAFLYTYQGPRGGKAKHLRWYDIFLKDQEIFESIKSFGPYSLCCSGIQTRINEWLAKGDIFGRKIKQLNDCLRQYAHKSRILPAGRPRKEMVELLGPEGIKDMHKDITSILKIAKKNPLRTTFDTIEKASEIFLDRLEESVARSIKFKEDSKDIFKVINFRSMQGASWGEKTKFFGFISEQVENDEELRQEFNRFNWEPNKFALRIIEKLLGAKPNTIHSTIYRTKKIS